MSPKVGGRLVDYLGESSTEALIQYVDDVYLEFGASNRLYGIGDEVDRLRHKASLVELRLIPTPIRHLGTDHCRSVLKSMRDHLVSRVDFRLETVVSAVTVNKGRVAGVKTESGDRGG